MTAAGLRPFWCYYGGKWRRAPLYPAPRHRRLIEPFAGAAGYALRHHQHEVTLVEKYPVVAAIWRYLIAVPSREILSIREVEAVEDLPARVPQEARWLVGFCLNSACTSPRRVLSSGVRAMSKRGVACGWNARRRQKVAEQVNLIRHWRVIEGDYSLAPNVDATWFIDPPYRGQAGSHYVYGSTQIDYDRLASWCRSRRGQVIACEAGDADWLPFTSHGETRGMSGRSSREAAWFRNTKSRRKPPLGGN